MTRFLIRRRKGFTLVEVIIVLVIVAIVAAIAIPSLTGYIGKAQERKLIAEGHDAASAMQAWATEQYGHGAIGQEALVDETTGGPKYTFEGTPVPQEGTGILSLSASPTAQEAAAASLGVDEGWWSYYGSYSWMWGSPTRPDTETCGDEYPKWVQYTGNDANFVDLTGRVTHAVPGGSDGVGAAIAADGKFSEAELWIDADGDGDNPAEQPKVATTQGDGNTVYSDEAGYWWLRIVTGDYASWNPNRVTGRASYYGVDRTGISTSDPFLGVTVNAQYFYELTSFGADKVYDASDDAAWTAMLKEINRLKKKDDGADRWYLDDNENGVYDAWTRGTSTSNPSAAGETWISSVGSDRIVVGGYDITDELADIEANPGKTIPAYVDGNGNRQYDAYTEPFMDWNRNGKWDAHYGPELMTGAVIHEWGCPLFGSNVRPTYEGAVADGQAENWKVNGNGIFKMHASAATADASAQMFNYAADKPFAAGPVFGRTTASPLKTYGLKPEYQTGTNIDSSETGLTGASSSKKYMIPMSEGNGADANGVMTKAAGNDGGLPGGLNNWVLHPWSFTLGAAGADGNIAETDGETALGDYQTGFAATAANTKGATNYVWQPVWRQYYGGKYSANAEATGNSTRTTASLYWNDPVLAQVFFAQSRSTYDLANSPADTLNTEAANRQLLSSESSGSAAGDSTTATTEARVSRALGETPLLVKDAARYLLPRFDGAFPKIGGTAEGVSYIADVAQYFGANTDIGPGIQSVLLDYDEGENRVTQYTPVGSRTYWTFGYGTTVTGGGAVAASSSYHMASVYGNTPVNNAAGGYTVTPTNSAANNAVANPTGWIGDVSPTLNDGAYPFYQPLSINTDYTKAKGWQDASAVTGGSAVDMASMEASPAEKTQLGHRSAGFANLNDDAAVTNGDASAGRNPIVNTLYGKGDGSATGVSNSAAWIANWNKYFTGGIVIGNLNAIYNAPYATFTSTIATNVGNGTTNTVATDDLTAEPGVTIAPEAAKRDADEGDADRYTVGFYTQDWIYMGSEARDPAAGMPMQVWNAGDETGWMSSTAAERSGAANSAAKASVYATYQNNWGYSGGWPDSYWSYLGDQRIMKGNTSDAKKAYTDPTDAFGRWSATTFLGTTYAASLQPSDITYGQEYYAGAAQSYKYPNLYYKGSTPSQSQASGNSNAASLSMGTAAGTAWSDTIWRRNWVFGHGLPYGATQSAGNMLIPGFASSAVPAAQLPTAVQAFANLSYGGNLMYAQNSLAWYSRSLPTMWWRGPLGNAYDPDGQDKDGMVWMGGESAADALSGAQKTTDSPSLTADIGEGSQTKYNYINVNVPSANNDVKYPSASALGYIAGYNIINRTTNLLASKGWEGGIPQSVSVGGLSYASGVVRDRGSYDASSETQVYYVADDVKLRYAYAAGREQEPVQHYFYPLSANMYNYDNTGYDATYYDTFDKYTINGTLNNPLGNQTSTAAAATAAMYASKNVKAEDSEFSQMTNLRAGDLLPTVKVTVGGAPAQDIAPDTAKGRVVDEYGRDPADPYEDTQYWYSVKMKSIESPTSSPYTGLTRAVSEMYSNDYVGTTNTDKINETSVRLIGNGDDFAIKGAEGANPLPAGNQSEIAHISNDVGTQFYKASGDVSLRAWTSEETGYMGTVAYTGKSVSGADMDEALPFGEAALTTANAGTLNTDPITGGIQAHDLYFYQTSNNDGEGDYTHNLDSYVANDFNFVRTGPRLRTVGQQLAMKSAETTIYERFNAYPGRGSVDTYMEGINVYIARLYAHADNGLYIGSSYALNGFNLANWEKGWKWDTSRAETVVPSSDKDDYIVAGDGSKVRLEGGDHIQDGYHVANLGTPMLYDANGDGIAGKNLAYADQGAAPEDTEEASVYGSFTVPVAAAQQDADGHAFEGYRVEAQGTEYTVESAATYWAHSTEYQSTAYANTARPKTAAAMGYTDADEEGYSKKAAAAGYSVASPATHKFAPTGEPAPNVLVSRDGGKTYEALATPAYVSPGDKIIPVSVIESGEDGDVYPLDGFDFEAPVWELSLTPVYESDPAIEIEEPQTPEEDDEPDVTPPSPPGKDEEPGTEDFPQDTTIEGSGLWIDLINAYTHETWAKKARFESDEKAYAVYQVYFEEGTNRLRHFILEYALYYVEYTDGNYTFGKRE
ncbi:MAG: prepilin-type N-terminal cleavage/methylation domain-containing protein [Clostridiales Family XIII bacterium]|jgi:prepilin-type N-terminal cleavage/methylation domain-containing protein|nr:prepilin-type N-terminal cleavage/methylation domain-containing protein [Clostridiales Family XIII bacterium]